MSSLQLSALGVASAIPLLVLGSGCQVEDDGGFRVTNVAFDGESTITLTFSEPVGELAGVDPESFRLSFASTYSVTYTSDGLTQTYEYTSYNDLSGFIDDYYTQFVTVTSLTAGSAADQIVLETNAAWGTGACDSIAYSESQWSMYYDGAGYLFDVGIFLHYAAAEIPVESASGSALANIGEDWVISGEPYQSNATYGFIKLSPQLRIPCP